MQPSGRPGNIDTAAVQGDNDALVELAVGKAHLAGSGSLDGAILADDAALPAFEQSAETAARIQW
ncbi:MAG: hypothetical protein NTX56_12365 [Proteobacteria bacterium]|nr:hypothetical protein [Pseudomonadota bacterium]